MRSLAMFCAALALVLITNEALAQWPGAGGERRQWEMIGLRTVGSGSDRDVIRVRGNERHRQLRICVTGQPVEFRDVAVVFGNGERQHVNLRNIIRPNSCTRAIDLKGRRRNIDRVSMTYSRLQRGWQPVVRVFAR